MNELTDLLRQGSLTAKEIMSRLGISQATLSRRVAEIGNVRKIGRGKSTRYVLQRDVDGQSEFPLYQINEIGHAVLIGMLFSVWPAESCALETSQGRCVLFDGLPWFITDMRPQGFLGRVWGRDISEILGLPTDITLWTESQTLKALNWTGVDAVGNVIVGQIAYQKWVSKVPDAAILLSHKIATYE